MAGVLDTGLDFYRQVLALRGYRQEILSADIANGSTPNFKAVDLDFKDALTAARATAATESSVKGATAPRSAERSALWHVSDQRHLTPSTLSPENPTGSVKYLNSTQTTLDGNSVDLDQVKALAAGNAVDYQAAATFTSQTIKMLMVAINGAAAAQQTSGGG